MRRPGLDRFPALYVILDAEAVVRGGRELLEVARALRAAEVPLLQYRDKQATASQVLERARAIGAIFSGTNTVLILNDWPELCVAVDWHGVHVGQRDLAVDAARQVVGPERLVGVSTHVPGEVSAAEATSADYLAIGPVYETISKTAPEPMVGLRGVEAARELTRKPLVAIGGITEEKAAETLAAGADSVAVIGALLQPGGSVMERTQAMLLVCDGVRHASDRRSSV